MKTFFAAICKSGINKVSLSLLYQHVGKTPLSIFFFLMSPAVLKRGRQSRQMPWAPSWKWVQKGWADDIGPPLKFFNGHVHNLEHLEPERKVRYFVVNKIYVCIIIDVHVLLINVAYAL